MAAAVWVTTQHRDPSNQSLSSPPHKPPSPVSPQASLVHSAPPLPEIYVCECLLQLLIWSLSTQQAGLSPTEQQGRVSLVGGAFVSSQAAATQKGVVCLSTMVAAVWGMSQHWDP